MDLWATKNNFNKPKFVPFFFTFSVNRRFLSGQKFVWILFLSSLVEKCKNVMFLFLRDMTLCLLCVDVDFFKKALIGSLPGGIYCPRGSVNGGQ